MIKKPSITFWVIFLSIFFSLTACFFFFNLNLHVSNYDALSRLNIARKVTDNLTPGLGQFGSIWPFLPQLIMVPFTAITPLWHNGIAGMILSAPAFIISGYLMYLILLEITKSKFISFIGFLIFITNINLLLLQTMAMSESLFICLILGAMYFLLQWVKDPTKSILQLTFAGICLSGASLTRYEGIMFTLASVIVVFIITLLKRNSLKVTEGITILFATIAFFGLFLWCLYNLAIFHDPLNWLKIYTGNGAIISTEERGMVKDLNPTPVKNGFAPKSLTYITSIAEVSGIPIFIVAILGFMIFVLSFRPTKNQIHFIILLPLSIIFFMLYTYVSGGGVPVEAPQLNINTIRNFKNAFVNEYNIRYGILLWPFVVIMVMWLMSKHRILKIIAVLVLIVHLITPLYHNAFLMYQLPRNWGAGSTLNYKENQGRDWFKTNYTGGLILISALKHDSVMFQLGLPYKTYLHEGTGSYWLTSRVRPEVYTEWIYMADPRDIRGGIAGGEEDPVTKNLQYKQTLKVNYIQRYNDGFINIYQRRNNPLNTTEANNSQEKFAGKVVDQLGVPISNVAVSTGSATILNNANGEFALNVNKEQTTIKFKKQGFETVTITLDLSESTLDGHKIAMIPTEKKTIFQKILFYL